ncbi:MAG: RNA-binding S4 domain-containing protein [Paracoccaceae bacterium]
MSDAPEKLRIDKWLWHARFFKTRSLAARQVSDGHVRLNGNRVQKTSQAVMADDVLTFPQARAIRVVRVVALGTRRGPAEEAQALYEDLAPPEASEPVERVGPRPTKKDRRQINKLTDGE